MPIQPVIHTNNLLLRPFEISDSSRVKELAGDSKIATTTLNVPHPYEDGMAELWINSHKDIFINKKGIIYALCMDSNVGSYRVMEKIGMKYEGTRKQDVIKNGVPKDLKSYVILKEEFNKRAIS
ncbi:GNAT family N-acetyltransferase [Clostridium algidicarnis]|uniref:GNAT family N-acetyltransferase n=1 Tax=Clostridium algidicarnis TaxID=37659 RepID=UPI001CF19F95|nr:GNAT family N-acetyltransferase [Clostridium algidicarnis]MCB2287605.1 GNAT family N-acetyltransferase [Clostridium algidicarnis]